MGSPRSTSPAVDQFSFHGRTVLASARQIKLRGRAERRSRAAVEPPPAALALRRALDWSAEMEARGLRRADIARREGITRARVTQLMALVDLPARTKALLLGGDAAVSGWSVKRALR